MKYIDFYDIANYVNEKIDKGIFSAREVSEYAYDYTVEFEVSKANGEPTHTIKQLAKLLAEDGSDQCKDWLYTMATELGLLDMNYWDYEETDTDIVARFFKE